MKSTHLILVFYFLSILFFRNPAYSQEELPGVIEPRQGEISQYENMDALIDSVIFGKSKNAPPSPVTPAPGQSRNNRSAGQAQIVASPKPRKKAQNQEIITIVLTGDTGFSRNHSKVSQRGVYKYGRWQSFSDALSAIRQDINGDINFTNIETVVTTRNNLKRDLKGQKGPFNFRSHPDSIRALQKAGFNLFSLANNHSMDYGVSGLKDTLKNIPALKGGSFLGAAGIGLDRRRAGQPVTMRVKGADIAYAAIGIVTNNLARHRAGPGKPGQIAYRFDDDFNEVTRRLREATGQYRILSIHYGLEGRVRTDARQIREWRRKAVIADGIDLVVGHHAHVVRGVERTSGKLIFYGLGNFMHHGTADMRGKGICRSYGLVARVHLLKRVDGTINARAVEAIPITNMHIKAARYASKSSSHARIHALNYLASTLDNKADGARGIRFTPQADGSGLYCFKGAKKDPGLIGRLCKNWAPAPPTPARLKRMIASSCSR